MSLCGSGLFLVFGLVTVQGSGYLVFKKSSSQSSRIKQRARMLLSLVAQPWDPPDSSPPRVLPFPGTLPSQLA